MICKICQSPAPTVYTFHEKMFGLQGEFQYAECSACGCLQIDEMPTDIAKYYPPYYYSYTQKSPMLKRLSLFKRLFAQLRINKKYSQGTELLRYLKEINTRVNDKILDVGCGKGLLISELFNQGFENVEGVDIFLPAEVNHGFGVKVYKKELTELSPDTYDLVMMNHVLEHMPEQQKALSDVHNVLKSKGCLMIRIPVLGEAWEQYRGDWVQLDAPRHLFLHTYKSLEILAQQTGFKVQKAFYDSSSFQFLGSELYKRGIPLFSKEDNYQLYSFEKLFDHGKIKEFEDRATALNKVHKGDSAVFYLYKNS